MRKLPLVIATIGLLISLSSCMAGPGPVGCTGTVNGKCVSTGTKPPAMF